MKNFLNIFTHLVIIFICLFLFKDAIIHNGLVTVPIVVCASLAVTFMSLYDLFQMAYVAIKTSCEKKEKKKQVKMNVIFIFNNRCRFQKVFTANTFNACIEKAIKYADAYSYHIESIEPYYE